MIIYKRFMSHIIKYIHPLFGKKRFGRHVVKMNLKGLLVHAVDFCKFVYGTLYMGVVQCLGPISSTIFYVIHFSEFLNTVLFAFTTVVYNVVQ